MPPSSSNHHSIRSSTGATGQLATADVGERVSQPLHGGASPPGSRQGPGIPQFGAQGATYHDGRVRNSVPSKLRGVTSGKNGNFSVMHMELSTRGSSERIAAAKKTSEGAEAASKRFNLAGYRPLRRIAEPHSAHDKGIQRVASRSSSQAKKLSKLAALNPQYTKAEQARLLTLLRSLNPVTVVDQLCTGLAYFGGIPGALPPPDGEFPESAAANGSGSLFVGWLAEIFPRNAGATNITTAVPPAPAAEVPPPSSEVARLAMHATTASPTRTTTAVDTVVPEAPVVSDAAETAELAQVAEPTRPTESAEVAEAVEASGPNETPAAIVNPPPTAKRGRGRPKGSKSSKVRTDKGTKRKSRTHGTDLSLPLSETNGGRVPGAGDVVERVATTAAGAANALQSYQPVRNQAPTGSGAGGDPSGPKKRGRPKGSKNRPKDKPTGEQQDAMHEPGPSMLGNSSSVAHAAVPASEGVSGATSRSLNDDTMLSRGAGTTIIATPSPSSSPSRVTQVSKRRRISQEPASQPVARAHTLHRGDIRDSSISPTLNSRQVASQPASATSSFHSQRQGSASMSEPGMPPHTSQSGSGYLNHTPQQLRQANHSPMNQQAMTSRQIPSIRRSQPANGAAPEGLPARYPSHPN